MPDPRITRLAQIMVHYSLALKPGQQVQIRTHPLADELTLAVYSEAIQAGANVLITSPVPGAEEIFYKYASDAQLDYVSPLRKLVAETFDASLTIWSEHNTHELAAIDPQRLSRVARAGAGVSKVFYGRAARGELNWCLTVYPTQAMAQDANMSLSDYREFVFSSMMLNEPDPVEFWKDLSRRQLKLVDWMKGHDKVVLKGENIDLALSIRDRAFINCDGRLNFPDGEVFASPVEDSVNGWVRFKYPAVEYGQEVEDIQLWFENGRVVKESASRNVELLTAQLNTDAGSRTLGEFGIGTNYGITRFTRNMLFDEKMGGTIHLAVGNGFTESGSKNESGIHWDMLCDMHDAEILVDGDLFYKNGKPVI